MLRAKDVTATKKFPSGAWEVYATVDGHLMTRTYYGYTKREAIRLFVAEANEKGGR
jgi:hypothetical protein